jgi:hypothetical protein
MADPNISQTRILKRLLADRQHQLSRSVRGADPGHAVADLLTARDLNRVVLTEHYGLGPALAAVAASAVNGVTPQGLRIVGQGIAENDSGAIAIAGGLGQRFTTTNEAAHTIGLATPVALQPDQSGPIRISALISLNNIATKSVFCGFTGAAVDALDPRVTGATTVLTLVDDDVAGLYFDANLGDDDRWFVPHNKGNASATIATTATGVDTGKDVVAATLTLVTVEIDADGHLHWVVSDSAGTSEGRIASALDADEEHAAVIYVTAEGAAVEELDILAIEIEAQHEN